MAIYDNIDILPIPTSYLGHTKNPCARQTTSLPTDETPEDK